METKSNHRVNIVRVSEIKKHPNADTLGIVEFGGYQCAVKLADWKPGDLGVYIQPDSVVPELLSLWSVVGFLFYTWGRNEKVSVYYAYSRRYYLRTKINTQTRINYE